MRRMKLKLDLGAGVASVTLYVHSMSQCVWWYMTFHCFPWMRIFTLVSCARLGAPGRERRGGALLAAASRFTAASQFHSF